MSDLAAFLTARLDEDEGAAKAAMNVYGADWNAQTGSEYLPARPHGKGDQDRPVADTPRAYPADHIARHDPARVLGAVAAKRAILKAWEGDGPMDFSEPPQFWAALDIAVRALAAVWSDHPDYDPAWRP